MKKGRMLEMDVQRFKMVWVFIPDFRSKARMVIFMGNFRST